jgi:hypothetical protein
VVKIGDIVAESVTVTDVDQIYKVDRVFCDIQKKKAMVDIVRLNNIDISMKLPALLVKLTDNSNDVSIVVFLLHIAL